MTFGTLPSIIATQEFVVPKSIPIISPARRTADVDIARRAMFPACRANAEPVARSATRPKVEDGAGENFESMMILLCYWRCS